MEIRLIALLIILVCLAGALLLTTGCTTTGHVTNRNTLKPGEELIIGTPPIRSLSNW